MLLLFLILIFAVIVYAIKSMKQPSILYEMHSSIKKAYNNRPSLILPNNYLGNHIIELFMTKDGREQYESLDTNTNLNAKLAYLYLNDKQDSTIEKFIEDKKITNTNELVFNCIANLKLPGTVKLGESNQLFPNLTGAFFGLNLKHPFLMLEKYNNIFVSNSIVIAKYNDIVIAINAPTVLVVDVETNTAIYDARIGGYMIVEPDFVICYSWDNTNFLIMEAKGFCMKLSNDTKVLIKGEFSMPNIQTIQEYRNQKGITYDNEHWTRGGYYKIFMNNNDEYIVKSVKGKSKIFFKLQSNVYAVKILDPKDIP